MGFQHVLTVIGGVLQGQVAGCGHPGWGLGSAALGAPPAHLLVWGCVVPQSALSMDQEERSMHSHACSSALLGGALACKGGDHAPHEHPNSPIGPKRTKGRSSQTRRQDKRKNLNCNFARWRGK